MAADRPREERDLFALQRFGADRSRLEGAIERYRNDPSAAIGIALHAAAESRRQELLRRLNLAPGGTENLVRMREDVLTAAVHPELETVDADFQHLFASWFNRGFLRLKRIDWNTEAAVLERNIRHEAVHDITSWDDLRPRIDPEDRRCFAFFHPQLPGEPLIFVEVALTRSVPARIDEVLAESRALTDPLAALYGENPQDVGRETEDDYGDFLTDTAYVLLGTTDINAVLWIESAAADVTATTMDGWIDSVRMRLNVEVADTPCPECGAKRARGDASRIVYCGVCGEEWHPGDPDYPFANADYAVSEVWIGSAGHLQRWKVPVT